jgi:hypothetical protein
VHHVGDGGKPVDRHLTKGCVFTPPLGDASNSSGDIQCRMNQSPGGWWLVPLRHSSWERDSNGHLTKTMSFRTSLEMHAFHEETSTTAWAKPHVGWWLVSCDVLVVGERPQLTDTSLAKRCACTLGMHALQEEISNAACTKSRGGWWLVVGVLRCSRGVRKTSIYRLTTNDSFRLHSLEHARVAPRDTQCRIH